MNKLRIVAVFVTIIAMAAFLGAAKKPAGPDKTATEDAVFGPYKDIADVSSVGAVTVGTNVWTYSPEEIVLELSESVVSNPTVLIAGGPHSGFARCLKKNGPEGGRLDFSFDCGADGCLRLIVRDGIYDRKSDTVVFDRGRLDLVEDWKGGRTLKSSEDGNVASFVIDFPPFDQ